MLLGALARFPDAALVGEALALAEGAGLDVQELLGAAGEALGTPEGRRPAWEWLRARFDGLSARLRSDEVNAAVEALGGAFCDAADRDAIAAFLTERVAAFDGAPRALAVALDRIDACAATQARASGEIARFLAPGPARRE